MLAFETYYHVYNHANGDDNLFRERKNYDFFLKKYRQHINPIADTIAWCLMPNHFHLLIRTKSEAEITGVSKNFSKIRNVNFSKVPNFGKVDGRRKLVDEKATNPLFLSKQFSNFFSSYTQSYNKVYGRHGSLFLKNFKRKEIRDENYLRNLILYIHLNPVRHGFTKGVSEWDHSSYSTFPAQETGFLADLFGDNENYQLLHQQSNFSEYENLENDLTQ